MCDRRRDERRDIILVSPALGGGGRVREGSKIISNKTNSMNIQSNLNIKYNIHGHCTDNMHLISIRKVADRKLQKKGK
jgi:diacylglycerol kinase family enzyme